MKKMTATKWVILVLAVLTACVAVAYLAGRPQVPEQTIRIEYNGKTVDLDIASLPRSTVTGTLVNGKGEARQLVSQGCLLSTALEKALGDLSGAGKATVTASDEFSAEVSAEEWGQPEKVYLTFDDGSVQLVVFGDSNSKRNVRNVERVTVE